MAKMPIAFIGHGSPMNAIENNEFTTGWKIISEKLPRPEAILVISAHWVTEGTKVMHKDKPDKVYDFCGFPSELYELDYDLKGSSKLADRVAELFGSAEADYSHGFDHGTWTVISVMYPKADIPVVQLSINSQADITSHYYIAEKLKPLRDEGVLILGSGNIVHNSQRLYVEKSGGYDWACEFDKYIKNLILERKFEDVLEYRSTGKLAKLSVPTPEHFCPLLYVLGASDGRENIEVYNNKCICGSISMTSYVIGL